MEIVRALAAVQPRQRGAVAAIGNFDGVHLGHRAVIGEAARLSGELHVPLAVLTFEPHPRAFFQPDAAAFRLTTSQGRATRLEELGVDLLFELPFDDAFAHLTAEAFVDDVLHGPLGLRHVVVGYDFNFGHPRRGTPDMLIDGAGHLGFGATRLAAVHESDGAVYSSSRIRQCLAEGDRRGAASLRGGPWEVARAMARVACASGGQRRQQATAPCLSGGAPPGSRRGEGAAATYTRPRASARAGRRASRALPPPCWARPGKSRALSSRATSADAPSASRPPTCAGGR